MEQRKIPQIFIRRKGPGHCMLCQDCPVSCGLVEHIDKITVLKNVFDLPRGKQVFDVLGDACESYRILKDNSHAYFFTRFDCYPYHYKCLEKAGFTIKNCMVIEKGAVGGIGDLKGSFANNSEWLIFCQKGRRTFNRTCLKI